MAKFDFLRIHQYWTFDVGRSMFDVQLDENHIDLLSSSGHRARRVGRHSGRPYFSVLCGERILMQSVKFMDVGKQEI